MRNRLKIFTAALAIFLIFMANSILFAQPGDPGGNPDQPVPISGIEFLIAAGAILGFRKLKSMRK